MNTNRVFAPHRALETAIAVARRLQDECHAQIQDVEAIGHETVIRLTIPTDGFGPFARRRIALWSSFVMENVEARRAMAATTHERIQEQRLWLERSRELARSVRDALAPRRPTAVDGAAIDG